MLAPKREYLRLTDGRFAFDLCAAPFGTGFFFSWWLVRRPATFVALWGGAFLTSGWLIHGLLIEASRGPVSKLPAIFSFLFWQPPGLGAILQAGLIGEILLWWLSFLGVFGAVALTARSGRSAAEEAMLVIPMMGKAYANLFAPQTYFRLDTAIMFRSAVHAAVLEVVDGLLKTKGMKALAPEDQKPVMTELLVSYPDRELEAIVAPRAGTTA